MAETPLPPVADDTVVVGLNPESTPAEIEQATARANNRDPRPMPGSESDAPVEDALSQDADIDDSADDTPDDTPQDEETQRPRMPRRVKQALDQRDAARQALDAEREYRIRLEERLAALERQQAQQQQAAEPDPNAPQPRPQYDDYDSEDEYFTAIAEWGKAEALREIRAELAQQRDQDQTVQAEEAQRDEAVDRHTRAITAARANHADFNEKIRSIPYVSPGLMEAFQHLNNSGEVLYHLASNPEELATLNAETNARRLDGALYVLDQRFSPSAEPTDDEPEPEDESPRARGLPPLNGAADGDAAAYNPYEDVGSQEAYRAWYDKQFGPKGG